MIFIIKTSPPSRGAWIEILWALTLRTRTSVAPFAGGVDRNILPLKVSKRNFDVAPLAGGGDRNDYREKGGETGDCRPPRGGAWIEISCR